MSHPIHLHGHSFYVLGNAPNSTFPSNMTVESAAAAGYLLNVKNPPCRDTTQIPEGGWLVIRFIADNPGGESS